MLCFDLAKGNGLSVWVDPLSVVAVKEVRRRTRYGEQESALIVMDLGGRFLVRDEDRKAGALISEMRDRELASSPPAAE